MGHPVAVTMTPSYSGHSGTFESKLRMSASGEQQAHNVSGLGVKGLAPGRLVNSERISQPGIAFLTARMWD